MSDHAPGEDVTTLERIVGDGVDVTLCVTEPLTKKERAVLTDWLQGLAHLCASCRQDRDGADEWAHDACTQPTEDGCCCNRLSSPVGDAARSAPMTARPSPPVAAKSRRLSGDT